MVRIVRHGALGTALAQLDGCAVEDVRLLKSDNSCMAKCIRRSLGRLQGSALTVRPAAQGSRGLRGDRARGSGRLRLRRGGGRRRRGGRGRGRRRLRLLHRLAGEVRRRLDERQQALLVDDFRPLLLRLKAFINRVSLIGETFVTSAPSTGGRERRRRSTS